MRSVLNNGGISKQHYKGTAWSKLWRGVIKRCDGFGSIESNLTQVYHDEETGLAIKEERDIVDDTLAATASSLACHPFTVIYGHAASRGLDIKKWTKGLDSG